MYKILSIDGGGIRGVIPAYLLWEMEVNTGKPISELFDLIAGTSTGGILAAGLTMPDRDSAVKPQFSAKEMFQIYENRGKDIFKRSLWNVISSIGGILDERYPSDGIDDLLMEKFQDAELKDALKDILVTSYDIENRQPYFFKRRKAINNSINRNHFLRDVCRATSAAPTYFEPAKVPTIVNSEPKYADEGNNSRCLIDGGVFANNPALCAYAEAIRLKINPETILLVSLGTGKSTRPIECDEAKQWGMAGWVKPVLSVVMDGVADAVHYQLTNLLPDINSERARYYRFDSPLNEGYDDMDNASQTNIEALKRHAKTIYKNNSEKFQALYKEL